LNLDRPAVSRRILTPSELTRLIRADLERQFSDFWIEGEVGSLRIAGSSHIYFVLKDAKSQIKGVIFRSQSRFLRFVPKEGQSALIRGHLSLYEARGEYELIVDYIEPKGAGALQAAFEALKERLSAEGLFDSSRKRPLPFLPRKIGIVTSPSGAALQDILKILREKHYALRILIAPVPVQGVGAAGEIARAVEEMGNRGDLDLLIVTRGGGSFEDLFSFNEEVVARAIVSSPIPVVSAVGHETDYTIADFVADLRMPTPSAAAERVVPRQEELVSRVLALQAELIYFVRQSHSGIRRHLLAEYRALQGPLPQINQHARRVDELSGRLERQIGKALEGRRSFLSQTVRHLGYLNPRSSLARLKERLSFQRRILAKGLPGQDTRRARLQKAVTALCALSPLAILARGYSIARTLPNGEIVRDARLLRPEDRVRLRFHRGEADCRVEEVILPSQNESESSKIS